MVEDIVTTTLLRIIRLQGGAVFGVKRFQKLVFLLKHEHGVPLPFPFRDYKYGPYSRELKAFVDSMVRRGLITRQRKGKCDVIQLTDSGTALEKSAVDFDYPNSIFKLDDPLLVSQAYAVRDKLKAASS
ncbi:MAG TPA: hypothetical protein ENN60_00505 [archaeon]|nr:hypothetical protein [archaeon]